MSSGRAGLASFQYDTNAGAGKASGNKQEGGGDERQSGNSGGGEGGRHAQGASFNERRSATRAHDSFEFGVFKTFVEQSNRSEDDAREPMRGGAEAPVLANSRVAQLQFGMLKTSDILRASHLEVLHRTFYEAGRQEPMPYGVLDRRLGTSEKMAECRTCHKPLADCIGHFG